MSDSDEDLMPSVLKYPNDSTANPMLNANPNFNNTNITNYNCRSNMMTSTFNMHNLERQRYMRGFDQRSMFCRRETSPMSLRSFPDSGMQNFHNSFYARGMSSQRSVFNGRSGSPVSMRSIDSNASVSAEDIAFAFKNVKFNKYDLRLIKDAYNKLMKNRVRKRIEKRRKLKLFLNGNRRRSGEDSGEQGSDSSISSDDCRSSRTTTLYKENIPKPVHRPFKTDLSHLRTTIKESDMYKDCTENLKQNSLRNMFAVNSTLHQNHTTHEKLENSSTVTLKDRFTKGTSFLLPSQRFNNKSTKHAYSETSIRTKPIERNESQETDSEKEEIFSEKTIRENNTQTQRKRVLDSEDTNCSANKRNKTTISPIKNNDSLSINTRMQKNDFIFKKPQMPIRNSLNAKKDVPERLLAKSRQPFNVSVELDLPINKNVPQNSNKEDKCDLDIQNKDHPQNSAEIEPDSNQSAITQNSNTDISMRPSFLKRKLFTQKLDVAESKNISSDNLAINSPQSKIYKECGEKNKVRKLVTSQSCLSRDVLGDDNVLDLIHKIVPPDQMNITSSTNRKELTKSNHESSDKWDVASVISMCNNNEGSDTYTDEEIFKAPQNDIRKNDKEAKKEIDKQTTLKSKVNEIGTQPKSTIQENKNQTDKCMVVVQKLQPKDNVIITKNTLNGSQCQNKRIVSSCVKSFWDTDFESDMEERSGKQWTSRCQVNQGKDIYKDTTNNCPKLNLNKRNVVKGTILTVRSFRNKGNNSSMRSDISKVSKRKDPDSFQEKKEENNNEMKNKNSRCKKTEEKEVQSKIEPKITRKSRLNNELNKDNHEKSKAKPVKTKEIKPNNNTSKHGNNLNITRESLRLKQKKESAKVNLSIQNSDSTNISKRGKPPKKAKSDNSNQKNNTTPNKKSKEKSTKDKKSTKNSTIIHASNKTRQTPIKGKDKKQLSSAITDQSILNITNLSTKSLRVRRKVVK